MEMRLLPLIVRAVLSVLLALVCNLDCVTGEEGGADLHFSGVGNSVVVHHWVCEGRDPNVWVARVVALVVAPQKFSPWVLRARSNHEAPLWEPDQGVG